MYRHSDQDHPHEKEMQKAQISYLRGNASEKNAEKLKDYNKLVVV